ncbi:MAG: glycosyltransferase family 39 protein [Crocinitomicaceae bacterium]
MRLFFRELYQSAHFRFVIILAVLAFIPTLGIVNLFDWDEINFAESAREMMVTGDYFKVQVNYTPFWEKPPFFFWLQAGSMHLFGVNEFAARFPNALVGIITVAILYFFGKKERDERFGLIWALLYLCAFLPQVYFRSAIIDPVFNLFIFLSAYYLFKALGDDGPKSKRAILSGVFCGLAVLTKGPVGFLLVFLTFLVYLIVKKFKLLPSFKQVVLFALTVLIISFLWFGVEVINNGPWFLVEFINYQIDLFLNPVAGHAQPFYYHFIVVFLGTFPLSVLALPSLIKHNRDSELERWWTILFWVVLILFSIVTTKIVHYSSMTYLPLSFLAAVVISKYKWSELKLYVKIPFFLLVGIYTLIFVGLPLFAIFKDQFLHLFKDPFAVAGFSNPEVSWSGFEPLIVLFYLAGIFLLIRFWKKDKLIKALKVNALLFSITLSLTMIFVVSKIERYTQGPMIDFLKDKQGEEVYMTTVGFKSYAHYFYFRQAPHPNAHKKVHEEVFHGDPVLHTPLNTAVKKFLLHGDIDYDAYFITKIQHTELDSLPQLEKLYQKGGYKFYFRGAQQKSTLLVD